MNSIKLIFLFALSCSQFDARSQDPCTYKTSSKKGGSWVFSTYYQPNTQIPLEGICEEKNGNAPFLYRSFEAGRLQKEVQYSTENKLVSSLEIYTKRRDSLIGEYKSFNELGMLMYHEIYFYDKSKRRCMHRKSYHVNGNPRFDQFFAWVKESELNEYQRPSHPPHTIDEDGYTYLQVPFGLEKSFDETGLLIQERRHQLLVDGRHEFASLHGKALNFHHNGKLKERFSYFDGKMHGEFVEFDFLGDTISQGAYEHGLKNGTWLYWYGKNKIKAKHVHNVKGKYPFHAQKEEWSESGKLIVLYSFDEAGNGRLREWTESGVLIHEQELVNLTLDHGKEKMWFPNGELKAVMNHTKNTDTVFYERFENGRHKSLKRNYLLGGNTITSIKEWYANGNLKEEVLLEKSEFTTVYSLNKYFENGNLRHTDFRKGREQFVEEYASNGIKIRSKKLLDGKIYGRFQEFDSTGQIKLDINYQDGLRHGSYKTYSNGKLSYEALYENGVWIPKDDKTKAFIDTYQKLNVSEKQIYTSAAYHILNRQLYAPESMRKTREEVDSIAAIIWQLNRVAPHYPEWTSTSSVGHQVLQIHLIQTYHGDLKTNHVVSEYSKELLAGLAQLHVNLPDFQFVNGEVYVSIELKEWINMTTIKQLFPKSFSLMQVLNPMLQKENSKYYSTVRYSIEQKTVNSWKITIQNQMNSYHILLYGDGTAEIENQVMSWSDFLNVDLSTPNNHPGWMYED